MAVPLATAAYKRWFAPPTYVYLLPGRGLGENSDQARQEMIPRRLFTLMQVGSEILDNVQISLQDIHAMSEESSNHVENYSEVDPGESNRTDVQPKHFWFKPATPWTEDYLVAITSREESFSEHILVLGVAPKTTPGKPTNPPPAPKVVPMLRDGPLSPDMGEVELAIRVMKVGSDRPVFSCEDSDLNRSEWREDNAGPCSQHSSDVISFEGGMDPRPLGISFPGGFVDMIPGRDRQSPISSHPEEGLDARALTGWQRRRMEDRLAKFPASRILILVTDDPATWRYARGFRDVFKQSRWLVEGPVAGPKDI